MSNYSIDEGNLSIILREEKKEDKTKDVNLEETATMLESTELDSKFDPVERIKAGFHYFKTNEFNKYPHYYRQLMEKQQPKFLVFACSDSRVCPSNILNFRPGEAFITRNIANMVPAFNQLRYSGVGAVIEYAVLALKVEVILVIGHSRCGGIERLMSLPDTETSYDFIDDWVKIGLPAKEKVLSENPSSSNPTFLRTLCEKEAVKLSLMNLLSYPYVRAALGDKKLKLMGGYYNFVRGEFEISGLHFELKPIVHI